MGQYKVYEIKQSIFKANDDAADVLRAEMKRDHCFLLNLMSSPGSGKTNDPDAHDRKARRQNEYRHHGSGHRLRR